MIREKYTDKALIVDILTKAFDSNGSVNYVIKQDKRRAIRIRKLMEYSFEVCWHFGEIYLSDDKNGVVLLLLPEKKKTTIKAFMLDISLVINSIGITRVFSVMKRESMVKKNHPENFIYLWYIGVTPGFQGKGIGSSLLEAIISLGNQRKRAVYLETSTQKNLQLYKRFGFNIYNEIDFNYKLYLLKRDFE